MRLLTAGSLVRAQQGEPKQKPLLSIKTKEVFVYYNALGSRKSRTWDTLRASCPLDRYFPTRGSLLDHQPVISYVAKEDFQWIRAALSGYEKDSPLSSVLQYLLPYADGYTGFWYHPLVYPTPSRRCRNSRATAPCVCGSASTRTSYIILWPPSDLVQYNANRMLWYSRFPRPLFRRVRRRA